MLEDEELEEDAAALDKPGGKSELGVAVSPPGIPLRDVLWVSLHVALSDPLLVWVSVAVCVPSV